MTSTKLTMQYAAYLPILLTLLTNIQSAATPLVLHTARQSNNTVKFDIANPQAPGICFEIIRALERIDPDLKFQGLDQEKPVGRIDKELSDGKLDVFFGLLKTPERERNMHFVSSPALYSIKHQVAVLRNDAMDVSNLEDIRRLGRAGIVLATMGTAFVDFLRAQDGLIVDAGAPSNRDNLRKLLAGRGRFFYHSDVTLKRYIHDGMLEDKIRILPVIFKIDLQLVATSVHLAPEKRARLNAALTTLEKTGELQQIRRKYDLH
ncbi:substrate-binding periplasmic protein [Chitinimonas naiadis]